MPGSWVPGHAVHVGLVVVVPDDGARSGGVPEDAVGVHACGDERSAVWGPCNVEHVVTVAPVLTQNENQRIACVRSQLDGSTQMGFTFCAMDNQGLSCRDWGFNCLDVADPMAQGSKLGRDAIF